MYSKAARLAKKAGKDKDAEKHEKRRKPPLSPGGRVAGLTQGSLLGLHSGANFVRFGRNRQGLGFPSHERP